MKNLEAAQTGDRRKALEELRDTLAEQLDSTEAQIHAQLAAQYRATLAEIEAMSGAGEISKGGAVDFKQRCIERDAQSRRATADASANA